MTHIQIPRLNHSTPSIIYFDSDIQRLQTLANPNNAILITNRSLASLYSETIAPYHTVIIPEGEANKTLSTIEQIHRELLNLGADRSVQLVGFGGGIVTDITGFAAATFMRGVAVGFVATTLLAQVDASVGGKNGVNLDGYKNMIGTFNQPSWVICPQNVLQTLPVRELRAGYAEAIKCGLLRSAELLSAFQNSNIDTQYIVRKSVEIKADIVAQDEREGSVRKLLNLGHTFAHGIEKCSNGGYLHGEAVAIGLAMAAQASVKLGLLSQKVSDTIAQTIQNVGLPISCNEIPVENIAKAMCSDKKKQGDVIEFIMLEDIAKPVIYPISVSEILKLF